MLNSLKAHILNWLGLTDIATKTDVETAFRNALYSTGATIDKRVAELVQEELDKDERTLVFDPDIKITVDGKQIQQVVQDAIAEACRPGGILSR